MNRLEINLGKEKLTLTRTDEQGTVVSSLERFLDTQTNGSVSTQDACDWWVSCASAVRELAEQLEDVTQIKELLLTGNRDGFVILDKAQQPLCAAVSDGEITIEEYMKDKKGVRENADRILSPVSYLRFMLTGEMTATADEKLQKEKSTLPKELFGRVIDESFEYFELSREAAFLMRLKRPVKVR